VGTATRPTARRTRLHVLQLRSTASLATWAHLYGPAVCALWYILSIPQGTRIRSLEVARWCVMAGLDLRMPFARRSESYRTRCIVRNQSRNLLRSYLRDRTCTPPDRSPQHPTSFRRGMNCISQHDRPERRQVYVRSDIRHSDARHRSTAQSP
jgi:hypothetical protein